MPAEPTTPFVRATQIGEFIRHGSCQRRFKLAFNDYELADELPFFFQLSSTMDPVLSEAGRRREAEWEGQLRGAGLVDLCRYDLRPGDDHTPWTELLNLAGDLASGTSGYGREIGIEGQIGAFQVRGQIDFLLLLWDAERERYRLRLVECKASRKDRTYHRIQLALYLILVRRLLEAHPLVVHGIRIHPADLEGVVARIDEATERVDDVFQLPPLDLSLEVEDVTRLLQAGGPLLRILQTPLEELPYQLDERCDDCSLATHCMTESARERRLELLGVDPSAVRTLRQAGLHTLDDVAELDLAGELAAQVRVDPGFTGDLPTLVHKARARRQTLPRGEADPEDLEVLRLPHTGVGQLPAHGEGGDRLVRIFVSVSYDYAENRIGAIAAHVTRSDRPLSTLFRQDATGKWRPDPDVQEQWTVTRDAEGKAVREERPVQGQELVGVIRQPWTGDYAADTAQEARLLEGFFRQLVQAVAGLAPSGRAPLHLYVWSRSELTRLIEACARCGGELLSHLRELLGCRAPLEQLIYSVLQDEVESRFALGWTGRGLAVATSLKWFGRRFHWTRRVGEEQVALDRVFQQDLFDFKSQLRFRGDLPGQPWRPLDDPEADRHSFEVRACFQDALPAPYWRAYWGTLPDPDGPEGTGLPPKVRAALRRYRAAGGKGLLRAYLKARVQALRWIEESIDRKNEGIPKPPFRVDELTRFTLGVDNTARAALDFLQLEAHVRVNDWLAAGLRPVAQRVATGRTLPLRDLQVVDVNLLEAQLDPERCALDLPALAVRCSWSQGDFVRLTPCDADPHRGQTVRQLLYAGSTCVIQSLDWERGTVRLSVLPYPRPSLYVLRSGAWPMEREPFPYATLDENPGDFVAQRAGGRLEGVREAAAYRWLDPTGPAIPAQPPLENEERQQLEELLTTFEYDGVRLAPDQRRAALEGLSSRLQLLLGPPGTGKTQTTGVAVLLRILARRRPGDVVLLTGITNLAVDTLLDRIAALLPAWSSHVRATGLAPPDVRLLRIHSSLSTPYDAEGRLNLGADGAGRTLAELSEDRVLLAAGTPNALLKLAQKLPRRVPGGREPLLPTPLLVVDEASMMVFPVFLSLATLLHEDGEILLAGDHQQLAPIVGHDWEGEDRPPAQLYQPYVSAYVSVHQLKQGQGLPDPQVRRSALAHTFRLPAAIRELLAPLYRREGVDLAGRPADPVPEEPVPACPFERLWHGAGGLYLVRHSECASKGCNLIEAELLAEILRAGARQGLLSPASVGVVVPHRAQRSLLKSHLAEHREAVDVLDTVERLQGGERETILVSATCSDPAAIQARADFLLSLNRANVAFSRAKRRLIVVCADSLLEFVPPELEHYQAALLWKTLRSGCSEPLGSVALQGLQVSLSRWPHSWSA